MMIAFLAISAGISSGGQITVTWTFPSVNEDGTALTDLAGARVYYGSSRGHYTDVIDLPGGEPGETRDYTLTGLTAGETYYLNGTAYNTAGIESELCADVLRVALNEDAEPSPIPAPTTYTVNYNANGATGGTVPAPQIKEQDVTLALAFNSGNLVSTGYVFVGWNTAANGSGADYAVGGTYSENVPVTLYAQWTQTISNTRRPAFTWPAIAGATYYQLWINRDGKTYATPWIQGTTTWTPPSDLSAGSYAWWVRSWEPEMGMGTWIGSHTVHVAARQPDVLTQLAPTGAQAGDHLTFRWNLDAHATWYRVWVSRPGGGTGHDRWYEMTGTGEGAATLNGHPGGVSTWWVRGWGPDGYGPWSGPMAFETPDPAPAKPVLTAPVGGIGDNQPTFAWQAAARATWYRVWVQRGNTKVIDEWTQDASLFPPIVLSETDHTWWVGSWNAETRQTVWSDRTDFTVSGGW